MSGNKIIQGMQEALRFAQGDKTLGRLVTPMIWSPTMDLRWSRSGVLQQRYACVRTGEQKWVPIPTEDQPK